MTDKEIIKALECCCDTTKILCDKECPLYNYEGECGSLMKRVVFDLINRQQTEIMETRRDLLNEIYALEHQLETTKAEAIKEFAERLKENVHTVDDDYSSNGEITYVEVDDIDNLVKEMVGDTE